VLTCESFSYQLKVSYLEIYKEELKDLLATGGRGGLREPLAIREGKHGIFVANLQWEEVTCLADMKRCLTSGARQRSVGHTQMNAVSSRSHAIFTIRIEATPKIATNADGTENHFTAAVLRLVDLAGSERAKRTGAIGNRLAEGRSQCFVLPSNSSQLGHLCGQVHLELKLSVTPGLDAKEW